ncbi:LacI family DNA-binding transcriptional regulator [Brachybacterium fresconis]|uniref:DNA-binding LacI/PurR family transcriptional regulator n=1 Tax=Brachybacterium fresconis TaxID=173363 RepID=A0ABS4YPB2_9MICO|nr:DNA-binding LacI/PurR family transcriptional regulator [Brachybacterium fresconis]
MRVRQRDIAHAAGVSQATVSLVVSGRASEGGVSARTQERVRSAMGDLGYVPDPVAQSLRGGRSGLIGVFTYEPVFPATPDDYFHEFLVGIEVAAAELGRDLVLFSSTQRADGSRTIYDRGANRLQVADGSVVLGQQRDEQELTRLAEDGYPFVSLGGYDPVPEAAWVAVDYEGAVRAIVEDLHGAGHRCLAYVRGDDARLPSVARREAFDAATVGDETHRVPLSQLTRDVVEQWIRDGVSAVVAENPTVAESLASTTARAGLRFPDDLSAVCLERPLRSGRTAGWSHLVIPKQEVGSRSVKVLAAILDRDLPADHHGMIRCLPHHLGTIAPVEDRPDRPARPARTDSGRQRTP